jgi:hypothetical protein
LSAKVLVANVWLWVNVIAEVKRREDQRGAIALVPWSVALLAVAALIDLDRLIADAAR